MADKKHPVATEKDGKSGKRASVANAMRIAIPVLLFFLIPFAVWKNAFGYADKFSRLPGISATGGLLPGIVAAVYVTGAVGVVAGVGIVATGGGLPVVDASPGDDPVEPVTTPTPNPTPSLESAHTPMPTSEPTSTPEPISTPNPTPDPASLEAFEQEYKNRLNNTFQNETLTDIPVLATEYRENDQGQTVLWIVYWQCDEADPLATQRVTVGNDYANSVGNRVGEQPDRLRIYGVTDLVSFQDTTTYIETSEAQAVWDGNIAEDTYTSNYWERLHEPPQAVNETAYHMVVNDSGQERADEAFYDDNVEVDGCPGEAEVGDGVYSEDNPAPDSMAAPALGVRG